MAVLPAELRLDAFRMKPPFHINPRMSPIPTRVYMPVIATPRQTSDMTLSGSKRICLLRTGGFPTRICPGPITSRGSRGIVPARKYKSELKGCLTSAAVARPLTSPLPDPFSAGLGGRNPSTGTCVVPCHQQATQGSRTPRNVGKLVVWPVP